MVEADALMIPGDCDPHEFTRAALEDYSVFLLAHVEVWRVWHERRGLPVPSAHSLEAEACIVSVSLFRSFYAEHTSYILPVSLTLPATWRCD